MPSVSDTFIQEFVLGFGFLGGLFAYIGVDPEEEAIRALLRIVIPNNEFLLTAIVILISIVSTIFGILGTYAAAEYLGLVVVGAAWVSGFIISIGGNYTTIGVILIIGALLVGPMVCKSCGSRSK